MLVTLSKICELHFRLLGTNGSYIKAENERFTAAACIVVITSNMKFRVVI